MCLTACAQKKGGERGTRQGGHMVINKDSDSTFVALKNETLKKFKQLTFNDTQTGKTMEYNLLVPEGAEAGEKLPLVLFMADASTAGKEVTAPLTQGYGALEFASDRDQQKHPSFVLVPQYTDWAVQDDWSTTDEVEMTIRLLEKVCKEYNVDTNRLYTTGQSMGGMMSWSVDGRHDVVLLQHHPSRPLCRLALREQPMGHLEDARLRTEAFLLHRSRRRPEGIRRHARPGKGAEGERCPCGFRFVECQTPRRRAGAIGRAADSPWRQHQLHQVGGRQRTPGNGPCHGAHGLV